MTKKQELKKHSSAIHTSGKLSLLERKLSNVLLYNAYDDLLNQQRHEINVYALAEVSGFNSRDMDTLKVSLKKLQNVQVEWDILSDNGEEEWGVSSLLASVKFNGATCTYEYSQALSEKLATPELYGIINLEIQKNFKSSHSLTIYEICSRYKGILKKRDHCFTSWYTLEKFKTILGVNESEYYNDFKQLNAKIIKPSVNEINGSLKKYPGTDIEISPEFKKSNRAVSDIRFRITSNKQTPLQLEDNENETIRKTDTYIKLCELGLSDKGAIHIIQTNDSDYIVEKIQITEAANERGEIKKSIGGYLKQAISEDYQIPGVPESNKSKAAKKEKEESQKQSEDDRKIKVLSKEIRQEYISTLTEEEQDELLISLREGKSPTIKNLIKSLSSPQIASEINKLIPDFEGVLKKRMPSNYQSEE